jgi:hypothetical protein
MSTIGIMVFCLALQRLKLIAERRVVGKFLK